MSSTRFGTVSAPGCTSCAPCSPPSPWPRVPVPIEIQHTPPFRVNGLEKDESFLPGVPHEFLRCRPVLRSHTRLIALVVRTALDKCDLLGMQYRVRWSSRKALSLFGSGQEAGRTGFDVSIDGLCCMLAVIRKGLKVTLVGVYMRGGQGVEVFPLALFPKRHKVHLQESKPRLLPGS